MIVGVGVGVGLSRLACPCFLFSLAFPFSSLLIPLPFPSPSPYSAPNPCSVILSRLRDLATRCHSLQGVLRRQHARSSEVQQLASLQQVTYTDLALIRRFRAANDALRWQLLQRDRTLSSFDAGRKALDALRDGLIAEAEAVAAETEGLRRQREELATHG